MPRNWVGVWAGGRIHGTVDGRKRYVLERFFGGVQHTFTLPVRDETGAMAQLAAWSDDPMAFLERRAAVVAKRKGLLQGQVLLTPGLLAELERDMRRRQQAGEVGEVHIRSTMAYCRQWAEDLGLGADLRQVSRAIVQRCLQVRGNARQHRIVALKVLGAFLVDSGRLDASQSPGRHVDVPTARPARLAAPRGYSADRLRACYAGLKSQEHRDVFRLQAMTGMHGSEVARIARGEGRLERREGMGEIAGVVTFLHKSGRLHSVSLDARSMAAAERLARAGRRPSQWALLRACRRHGVQPAQLRHSFVQLGQGGRWAYPAGQGVSVDELIAVTGHSSSTVTRAHYDGGTPRMLVLPLALEHAADAP
jgi:integrase